MAGSGSTKGGLLSEGSGLVGGRIPAEVESMARLLRELEKEKELFRKLLKVAVSAVEGKDCREAMTAVAQTSVFPQEHLSQIVAGMYSLLRGVLRLPLSSLKQEAFKEELRELRISEEFITDFASVVFGNRRVALETAMKSQAPQIPSMEDFRWRVDVAISTSSLVRALQPSILMQMKLSDGKTHQFEVPVSKFQELRYNIALILKEMNDLEKRSILKIQD